MEVSFYIFKKDDTKSISNYDVKRLMKVLSDSIEDDSFVFLYDNKEYKLNYLISKDGNKCRILKITIDCSEFRGAIVLDAIKNTIIKGEHRSNYFITVLYDDASSCFCKKAMPYIAETQKV